MAETLLSFSGVALLIAGAVAFFVLRGRGRWRLGLAVCLACACIVDLLWGAAMSLSLPQPNPPVSAGRFLALLPWVLGFLAALFCLGALGTWLAGQFRRVLKS